MKFKKRDRVVFTGIVVAGLELRAGEKGTIVGTTERHCLVNFDNAPKGTVYGFVELRRVLKHNLKLL